MKKEVILITGASAGMGKDFARTLAQKGFKVYGAARRIDKMEDLKPYGVTPIQMDITDHHELEACIAQIESESGGVDILINNAGFGMYGAMEDVSIEDARYQFEVNLFGVAALTKLVLPNMRENGRGKIINISSVGGKIYAPLGSWYHATKHALEGWSDVLRLEVNPFGIDVVIIEPGSIQTEFGDVLTEPMLKRSGNGVYSELTHKMAKLQNQEYQQGGGSPTSVITDLVVKSITAKTPKTRYSAGKYAKSLLFVRRWFSDRFFDRMIMSMLK